MMSSCLKDTQGRGGGVEGGIKIGAATEQIQSPAGAAGVGILGTLRGARARILNRTGAQVRGSDDLGWCKGYRCGWVAGRLCSQGQGCLLSCRARGWCVGHDCGWAAGRRCSRGDRRLPSYWGQGWYEGHRQFVLDHKGVRIGAARVKPPAGTRVPIKLQRGKNADVSIP